MKSQQSERSYGDEYANPPLDTGDDELQWVVARIRARKASLPLVRPEPAVLAAIVAHLHNEEPLTAEELAQHEREWRAVEDEWRAVEWRDMQKERRI
jgi:hypothetical protein